MKTFKQVEEEVKMKEVESYKVLEFLKKNKDKMFTGDDIKKEGLYPNFEDYFNKYKWFIFGYECIDKQEIDGEDNYYYSYDTIPFPTVVAIGFITLLFVMAYSGYILTKI